MLLIHNKYPSITKTYNKTYNKYLSITKTYNKTPSHLRLLYDFTQHHQFHSFLFGIQFLYQVATSFLELVMCFMVPLHLLLCNFLPHKCLFPT